MGSLSPNSGPHDGQERDFTLADGVLQVQRVAARRWEGYVLACGGHWRRWEGYVLGEWLRGAGNALPLVATGGSVACAIRRLTRLSALVECDASFVVAALAQQSLAVYSTNILFVPST